MSLADLDTETEIRASCSIGRALVELDADDQTTLRGWLESGRSGAWIETQLIRYGRQVGRQAAGRHRRGECGCVGL